MYLSKLEIVGFKSFAHKTALKFNDGITAVVGPNGCGKCVDGETFVSLADGREVRIRDLVEGAFAGASKITSMDDGAMTLDNPEGIRVLSLNPDTLRLESREVGAFVRREATPHLLRIRTRSGREVSTTPYHPLFTIEEGRLRALKAEELRAGIPIAVPRRLPSVGTNQLVDFVGVLQGFTADDGVFVPTSDGIREWANDEVRRHGSKAEWGRDAFVLVDRIHGLASGQSVNASVLGRLAAVAEDAPPIVYWDEIVSIEEVSASDTWVYDLCIPDTHNFVAGNIIVHNSNIIDSIRWVIGEQKASTLRSDKMEEVIFNGAGKRRPLGMAEVSLTIENTKGILPTEYSEVVITRRLFRNGDSEYLLNKVQCRLKDIVDLFMDTGMGANAYSVIELKMIETILSDRAEERRRLFDEAAGVTKYKIRRREALRRLDATQQDLVRVVDITREVAKKVGSLERQAKRAAEYTRLDRERKELETQIYRVDYAATLGKIVPLEEKLAEARHTKRGLDAQLAEEDSTIRDLEHQQGELEAAHRDVQQRLSGINEQIAQLERRRAVAEERKRSLTMTIERAERDRTGAQEGIESLMAARAEVERSLESMREQIRVAESEYETVRAEVSQREAALNDRRRQAKGSQGEVITLLNRISELRGSEERTRARLESIRHRLDELEGQDDEARSDRIRAEESLAAIELEVERATRSLLDAQEEFELAQERKGLIRSEIDKLRTQTIELHNQLGSRRSKIEFLSGLVDQDESVRFLVSRADWSSGERITVAESLDTDEQYRIAIATALGNAAHYLVVPTFADAARGMQSLESNRKGKATFVCLDRVPGAPQTRTLEGLPAIGWASELCSSSPEHGPLREYLLGQTAVVRTVDDANAVIGAGTADQAVTVDGVLVRSGGVVRGGGQRNDEGITIGKREQIERLEREAGELQHQLDALENEIAAKGEEHDALDLGQLSDAIRRAQQEVGQIEKRRAQAEYEVEYASDLLEEHQSEREQMSEELLKLEEQLHGTEPQREELRRQQAAAEEGARELAAELDAMEAGFAEVVRAANERHVALVGFRGEERAGQTELDRIRRDHENAERLIQQRLAEKERAERELERLEEGVAGEEEQLEKLRAERTGTLEERDEIVRRQGAKREEIAAHADAFRAERKDHELIVARVHELDMKIQELRSHAAALVERAQEELEIDIREHVEDQQVSEQSDPSERSDTSEQASVQGGQQPAPQTGIAEMGTAVVTPDGELALGVPTVSLADLSITELRARLRERKDRLKTLGTVNLLAYEEWMQESERHSFLQQQSDDLKNAEKSLLDTIVEINETAQAKFQETFELIRRNFTDIFTSLFHEGDEADLRLEEGDPLEAKIEIIAKPRGKRPHSIDLLSGGEKTLTAIALLFAIYLVKPSPFCILDEVDAPLDDANVDRFIQLIRRFATDTQFILVTHNKRTMSAADTMYGVTQEEDGVSKIVSVRFTESGKV